MQNNIKSILFLCTGNSCRSQMAEGIAKKYLHNVQIESAGTNPESVNPNAIYTMKEINIDISKNHSKKINDDELLKYDLVITLCGDARDKCPLVIAKKHIHWPIPDPAKFNGNDKEKKIKFSEVRNIIESKIKQLKNTVSKV